MLLLALLLACNPFFAAPLDDLDGAVAVVDTKRSGTAVFRVPVPDGQEALLFTAEADAPYRVFVQRVWSPAGDLAFDAEAEFQEVRSHSGAMFPDWSVTLGWPVLDDDVELSGGTWEIEVGAIDLEDWFTGGVPISGSALYRPEVSGPVLPVNVLFAETARDDDVLLAVERAIPVWEAIYADLGITLEVELLDIDVGDVRGPGDGDRDTWRAVAEAAPPGAVNVLLIEEILDSPEIYGIAGGIPGPLVPTGQSGVAISTLVNSGFDGVFSQEESRLLGETLAHEVGHYLGLFHPVEVDWDAWDGLSDTPECEAEGECSDLLGENLMFPYPLCDSQGCVPQQDTTAEQGRVAARYLGAR